jgi:hypothetical protein
MALVKDKKKGENKDIFEIVAVDSGYGRLLALLLVVISRLKRKKKNPGVLSMRHDSSNSFGKKIGC